MKQRDQYSIIIPYDIKDDTNNAVPITDVSKIQFSISKLVKEYPSVVTYDANAAQFEMPITEAESAAFPAGKAPCQMRVHFADGGIKSSDIVYVNVGECLIKV